MRQTPKGKEKTMTRWSGGYSLTTYGEIDELAQMEMPFAQTAFNLVADEVKAPPPTPTATANAEQMTLF